MTYLQISLFLCVCVYSSLAKLSCSVYEVEDNCPSICPLDTCPKDALHDQQPCVKPKECPPPACKCDYDRRRAENGSCIEPYDCPPFSCPGLNEVHDPCPTYCPSDDCSDSSPSGRCPFPLLVRQICAPACRCIKGFWRKDGVCVPFEKCPPNDNQRRIDSMDEEERQLIQKLIANKS